MQIAMSGTSKIITILEYILKRKNVIYLDFIFVIILSSFFYFIFV